ncbi:hypothetical protein LGM62_38940, partial [Burkholderia contaminans]|uniref:hypothetical protein n=1 Tax=Burkholderia contaminans TaxID=488447 RepID=UPI001CF1EEFD
QASCGGSPWFPVREVGPGNPILSDSTGEPPPSTFNYAWDIALTWEAGQRGAHDDRSRLKCAPLSTKKMIRNL